MSRRTIAISLIIFGLVSIIAIAIWLWWPYRNAAKPVTPTPVAQPPGYSTDQAPAPQPLVNVPVPVPTYNKEQINLTEARLQELLRHKALDFTARAGTYANADEFAGIKQVYVDATPALQTFLETQRLQLVKDHPMRSSAWGQTVRALSSRFASPLPIGGGTSVTIVVQAQAITGADGETQKSYKQATIDFTLVNGAWVANRIVWGDIQI